MMEELIAALTRDAGLAPEQAALAAAAMLRFLTARLPSNLVGQLHERLDPRSGQSPGTGDTPDTPSANGAPRDPSR